MGTSNPFGVLDFLAWDHEWNGHHYPLTQVRRAASLMRQAGIGFVRMDFLWSDIEPARGRFDFAKYEALVDCLANENLEILGLLLYNPIWRPVHWASAPIAEDYLFYARAVVGHFKGSVHHWEIWNEPDLPIYWQPQDQLRAYSQLLKAVYPELKRADPSCQVLMGALTDHADVGLERLYDQAGSRSFDIANLHSFVSPLAQDPIGVLRRAVNDFQSVMRKNGDGGKPLWLTEIGCPGSSDPASTWWLGKSPTEAEQAQWVTMLYSEALQWKGIEKIFWAFFRDTKDHFKDGVDYLGLVRNDFSPKPAYAAYQAVSRR